MDERLNRLKFYIPEEDSGKSIMRIANHIIKMRKIWTEVWIDDFKREYMLRLLCEYITYKHRESGKLTDGVYILSFGDICKHYDGGYLYLLEYLMFTYDITCRALGTEEQEEYLNTAYAKGYMWELLVHEGFAE